MITKSKIFKRIKNMLLTWKTFTILKKSETIDTGSRYSKACDKFAF